MLVTVLDALGTASTQSPGLTLDLDSGLGVTQGPDVNHHVHAPRGKVLIVW